MMTNKEMQNTVKLLCDRQTVKVGRYLMRAHEVKEDENPCAKCYVYPICTCILAELCMKCDEKTGTEHYLEIVG